MINFYIYVFVLIMVFLLLFIAAYLTRFAPKKIKTITKFIILVMFLRYFSLLILFLSSNIKYLYLLKITFFLNFVSIPLLVLTVLYVFVRIDNVEFSYIFVIASIILILYTAAMYKCPGFLQNTKNYGYTMLLLEHMYIYWIYIVLNTVILFISLKLATKKNVIKIGVYLVSVSALITIVELIIWTMGIMLLQEIVLGDILWILTLVYALNKVKKRNI